MILLEKLRTLLPLGRRASPPAPPKLRPFLDEIASAWPFNIGAVGLSPADPGVYLLYRKGRLVYIGLAAGGAGIRGELQQRLRAPGSGATHDATAFLYAPARDAAALHRRYLSEHRARYGGRLPLGNERELAAP